MQRPVMDPTYYNTADAEQDSAMPYRLRSLVRFISHLLVADLLWWRHGQATHRSTWAHIGRAFLHWGLFLPPVVLLLASVLVYRATHRPALGDAGAQPSYAIYHETVKLQTIDGVDLTARLFPVLDAARVLKQKEAVLRRSDPAVILIQHPGQDLRLAPALVQRLHDAGMVVLLLELRGHGHGRTFGITESLDVQSAVEFLRTRPFVAPDSVAVVGCDIGASAALIAASHDPSIAALCLTAPLNNRRQALNRIAAPGSLWVALQPVCRWVFQLAYGVNLDDLDVRNHATTIEQRPTLIFAHEPDLNQPESSRIDQIVSFLTHHLSTSNAQPVGG